MLVKGWKANPISEQKIKYYSGIFHIKQLNSHVWQNLEFLPEEFHPTVQDGIQCLPARIFLVDGNRGLLSAVNSLVAEM